MYGACCFEVSGLRGFKGPEGLEPPKPSEVSWALNMVTKYVRGIEEVYTPLRAPY